jgi:integrase/recombinase XerD
MVLEAYVKKECGRRDLNPSYKLGKPDFLGENRVITKNDYNKYLARREIQGLTKQWLSQCNSWLVDYLDFVKWHIDEDKTLKYCQQLNNSLSIIYYKKHIYQIRRFLEYLKVDWASTIKLPPDPEYLPKRISEETIQKTLAYYEGHKYFVQIKSLILLGVSSGMRAEELYQLKPSDIDLNKRTVYINHNPQIGQSTKTRKSRVSFFNKQAENALYEFLDYFNDGSDLRNLFTQSHITRIFKNSNLKIKDLRKYFSQEWDRRGGPTSVKKILMGHSLKADVDLMHYNCQSEEDLKKIYDKVMLK